MKIIKLIETEKSCKFADVEPGNIYSSYDEIFFVSDYYSGTFKRFDTYSLRTGEYTATDNDTNVKLLKRPEELSFKEQLTVEIVELSEKIEKIENYMTTSSFKSLPDINPYLLKIQLSTMQTYLHILNVRMSLINE